MGWILGRLIESSVDQVIRLPSGGSRDSQLPYWTARNLLWETLARLFHSGGEGSDRVLGPCLTTFCEMFSLFFFANQLNRSYTCVMNSWNTQKVKEMRTDCWVPRRRLSSPLSTRWQKRRQQLKTKNKKLGVSCFEMIYAHLHLRTGVCWLEGKKIFFFFFGLLVCLE